MALWEASAGPRPCVARLLGTLRSRLTWRHGVFALTLVLYAVMTAFIVVGSPMDTLDERIVSLNLHQRWPGIDRFMLDYVMLGQRAPSTLIALPWFLWLCHRRRSLTPLIRLATALLLLNVSVGLVKISVGRYGPLKSADAHNVLAGGNIFPSGHAANAVVLYGVMAMSVLTFRRTAITLAAFVSATVGLTTLYLNTHWLSDVVGAWLAGGLVLMVLPLCVPVVERALHAALRWVAGWFTHGPVRRPAAEPAPGPRVVAERASGAERRPEPDRPRKPALAPPRPPARVGFRGRTLQSAARTDSTVS